MQVPSYRKIGCFVASNDALKDYLGVFKDEVQQNSMSSVIGKCAELAFDKNYTFFALGNKGVCRSGPNATKEYYLKGSTGDTSCPNGIGNSKYMAVYTFGMLSL